MKLRVGKFLLSVCFCFTPFLSQAAEFTVGLDIPRLNVAEYHRPYVAMWIATESNQVMVNLNVLYDLKLEDNEGEKWLKDMRQWWRRSGRRLEMPVDGVSGATRGPGSHEFSYADKVTDLEPGQYRLIIEAVREVGGRELLEIPFQWPAKKSESLSVSGEEEVGKFTLTIAP